MTRSKVSASIEAAHTPTPWTAPAQDDWRHHMAVVMAGTGESRIQVACCYDNHVKRAVAVANAAFIVRACNSYDDMLAALKRLHQFVRTIPLDVLPQGKQLECWTLNDIARAEAKP